MRSAYQARMDALVSTAWLADALADPDLRIVDATLFAADLGRDAEAEFLAGHVPGAVFLDLASLRDTTSPLPNMLPNPELFEERVRSLGIASDSRVVLYDDSPWHTSGRAWWLLRSYGAANVALLDGGVAKWRAEGRPLDTGRTLAPETRFTAQFDRAAVRTLDGLERDLKQDAVALLDARSASRFTGEEPDPHTGTAPGHIPGARNLPYTQLFEADGTWKRGTALTKAFADAGIDWSKPLVTTCGSGITASVLAFAAHLVGHTAAVYDGSWSEWGADPSTPKAIGPA